jgi:thymidylate synthase (FAD)
MAQVVAPKVRLVGWTHFEPPGDVPWSTDAEGGQALAEFAGRACYQSWDKPVPATATNAGYLRHLIEVGHLAVLEHATATFYLTGVSRAFSQQLVRHRHLSYSELSPRYLPDEDAEIVEPAAVAADPELHKVFLAAAEASLAVYRNLVDGIQRTLGTTGAGSKQARQVARSILPGAVETRLVVTGNYRAWRHFVAARAVEHADVELRQIAIACLRELQRVAPNAFGDFTVTPLGDGTEIAASPFAWEA